MAARSQLLDRLDDQVALVTGANRGIGREVAIQLARLGATVYATTRDMKANPTPAQTSGLQMDVRSAEQRRLALDEISAQQGRLDVLVNNAAIYDGRQADLRAVDEAQIENVLQTNLLAPTLLTRLALPLLLRRPGGRVVNVTTGLAVLERGFGAFAPSYRISKVGLNGLTRYLAGAYAQQGLIANAVAPGWVRTDMGGARAPLSVAEGADTVVWLCRFDVGSRSGLVWENRRTIRW